MIATTGTKILQYEITNEEFEFDFTTARPYYLAFNGNQITFRYNAPEETVETIYRLYVYSDNTIVLKIMYNQEIIVDDILDKKLLEFFKPKFPEDKEPKIDWM